jgi:hypothetical protein
VAVVVVDKAVQIKTETQVVQVVVVVDLIRLLTMADLADLVHLDKVMLEAPVVLLQNVEEEAVVLELLAEAAIFEAYDKTAVMALHI